MARRIEIHLFVAMLLLTATPMFAADRVRGTYLEARTCQVYTGPCFANGEVGAAGKDALMAWSISSGTIAGKDVSGLNVAAIVSADNTLGFGGFADAKNIRVMILVDRRADAEQRAALEEFVLRHTRLDPHSIVAVRPVELHMTLDLAALQGRLTVPGIVSLATRKARPGDCICSNESAYYPPLADLAGFVPGVTTDGDVRARPLGRRWSIPDSRTAYLGTFDIASDRQLTASL